MFESDWHEVKYVDEWEQADIENTFWGVAFVDHAPAGRRKCEIQRLAQGADHIVIHDSEHSQKHHYHYDEIYPLFKYKHVYRKIKPHTTILSNFKEIR